MADPIADFMAITNCNDEEVAIELLSSADFDVHTAVAIYNATRGGGGGGGSSNNNTNNSNTRRSTPPPAASSTTTRSTLHADEDADLARAIAESQRTATGGGGGGIGGNNNGNGSDYDYVDDDFGGGDVGGHAASNYNPTAQNMMDDVSGGGFGGGLMAAGLGIFGAGIGNGTVVSRGGGARSNELNKDLVAIDQYATFDPLFLRRHFGDMALFHPPSFGCEGRYIYMGEDPTIRADSNFGIEHNPIITHFKYCCAVAEKQKKFVFLLILRGERTFYDSCVIRDLLSQRSSSSAFLKENFLSFFQVALPDSLEHVRTTQLSRLQTNQPDVQRMIHLNSFLSTYQIGTDPAENLLPGHRYPTRVETEEQRKCYNIFCRNAFPILAVVNPQTQSLVKRIPLGALYKVRGNAAQLDADVFMEELTSSLDSNMLGDNFFLREETDEGLDRDAEGGFFSVGGNTPVTGTDSRASGAGGDATVPKGANAAAAGGGGSSNATPPPPTYSVDDEDDYDYDYADDYNSDDDNATIPSASVPRPTAATATVIEESPAAAPQQQKAAAAVEQAPLPTAVDVDISPFTVLGSSSGSGPLLAPADCIKIRLGTPKGQLTLDVSKSMPLRAFLLYLVALCYVPPPPPPSAASTGAEQQQPLVRDDTSSSPCRKVLQFTMDLVAVASKTRFLGGFPPKPLVIDEDAVFAPMMASGDGEAAMRGGSASVEAMLQEGPSVMEWGQVRNGDIIRPSLP